MFKRKRVSSYKAKKYGSKRRRFNVSKRYRIRRIRGRVPNVSVKRKCYLGTVVPNTTGVSGYYRYIQPSLSSGFTTQTGGGMPGLTNVGEYAALFDMYKLNAFKIELVPKVGLIGTDQATIAPVMPNKPYLTIIKDPSATVTPAGTYSAATLNAMLENGNAKTYNFSRKVTIYMKPKISEQYGNGATRLIRPMWTDLNAVGQQMPHRGFYIFQHTQDMNPAGLSDYSYDVFITYYLHFKGMR